MTNKRLINMESRLVYDPNIGQFVPQYGFGSFLKKAGTFAISPAAGLGDIISGGKVSDFIGDNPQLVGTIAGATLGTAIAPGIGTQLGASLGGQAGGAVGRSAQQRDIEEAQRRQQLAALGQQQALATQGQRFYQPTFQRGGFIDYSGQTHDGANGGIPVDAHGNPSRISGQPTVALTEDNEVTWNTPDGRSYVFSDKLGFADDARKLMNKYKRRLGKNFDKEDPMARDAMNAEFENLLNQQEEVRARRTNEDLTEATFKYGGDIPELEEGRFIQKASTSRKTAKGGNLNDDTDIITGASIDPTVSPIRQRKDFSGNFLYGAPIFGLEGREKKFATHYPDLVRYYGGKKLEDDYLKLSKYRPAKSSDKSAIYISIDDPEFKADIVDRYNRNISDTIPGGSLRVGATERGFERSPSTDLGHFTISKGKDESGEYLSYYDIYNYFRGDKPDVNKTEFFGGVKPYELYDRIYVDKDKSGNYKEINKTTRIKQPTHTMPDGTVMAGATHEEYANGGFIQKALKPRKTASGGRRGKGSLTAAAKSAGESISEYCASPPSSLAKKRCAFRETLMGLRKEDGGQLPDWLYDARAKAIAAKKEDGGIIGEEFVGTDTGMLPTLRCGGNRHRMYQDGGPFGIDYNLIEERIPVRAPIQRDLPLTVRSGLQTGVTPVATPEFPVTLGEVPIGDFDVTRQPLPPEGEDIRPTPGLSPFPQIMNVLGTTIDYLGARRDRPAPLRLPRVTPEEISLERARGEAIRQSDIARATGIRNIRGLARTGSQALSNIGALTTAGQRVLGEQLGRTYQTEALTNVEARQRAAAENARLAAQEAQFNLAQNQAREAELRRLSPVRAIAEQAGRYGIEAARQRRSRELAYLMSPNLRGRRVETPFAKRFFLGDPGIEYYYE